MKILCETNIVKRSNREIKGRFVKSTLAIGKKDEKSNLCLILITSSNKSGTKYDLTNNLAGIFRKFVDEGKCTISFKLPEIDLQIKSDPIQLKAFLNVMKNELCPDAKRDDKNNKLLRAFGSTTKMITEVTKLIITERKDFPSKGFPRTLKELHITDVGCLQMPIGVLNLTNLTFLNLSNNQITKIHKSLGNIRLSQLIVSNNKLGDGENDWQWLNGKNLQSSLHLLNLSGNKLKGIPSSIANFANLVTLNLATNEIQKIPFFIQQMKQLRHLNLSHNQLKSLPCTFKKLLLSHVDLSGNQFPTSGEANAKLERAMWVLSHLGDAGAKFPTLFEISSRIVLKHKIPYMSLNIPKIIKEILFLSSTCARCDNFCFDRYIFQDITKISLKSGSRVTDNNESEFLVYGPLCSSECYGIKN